MISRARGNPVKSIWSQNDFQIMNHKDADQTAIKFEFVFLSRH